MSRMNDRRDFLKNATMAGVGFWAAGNLQAAESNSPNEKIRFACIGVGGKGQSDSDDAAKHGDVVAICDVDDNTLESAAKKWPNAKKYNDYRKLLQEMEKGVDAVTVSTPDHNHAAASAMAMRMKMHCFTQKPLTHSIYEARKLAEIAREMKVATQMGNQGTADNALRKTAAVVRNGGVGTVKEVHVWTNRPIWTQGQKRGPSQTPPSQLHWDLWLGPAPKRDYAGNYHPFAWRGVWDFGTGALGDMACHTVNMPFMALDLRDPISVEAETSENNKEQYPNRSVITYQFPANDKRPAVTMVWYDGGKRPSKDLFEGKEVQASGVLIVGEKGKLYAPGDYCENGYSFISGGSDPTITFKESPGHFAEYARAIKGGEAAMSNFADYAGPLTESILLGNLAVWAGSKVEWDAKNMKATNNSELDQIIKPIYREGYTL